MSDTAKDIIDRDKASIDAITKEDDARADGNLYGYKVFGGMSVNQIQNLPPDTQRDTLIAIYETRVLGKIDHIGVCIHDLETKKQFMNIDGSWRQIPFSFGTEVRPSGYFTPDVNCVRLGSNMEDGPWYFISTPTKEQYEALLAERDKVKDFPANKQADSDNVS